MFGQEVHDSKDGVACHIVVVKGILTVAHTQLALSAPETICATQKLG